MIIRTEESLAIGGKYLQGIALETVEECRRLCCETDNCDVFVFEEKVNTFCYNKIQIFKPSIPHKYSQKVIVIYSNVDHQRISAVNSQNMVILHRLF